jgi:hypothetical protein
MLSVNCSIFINFLQYKILDNRQLSNHGPDFSMGVVTEERYGTCWSLNTCRVIQLLDAVGRSSSIDGGYYGARRAVPGSLSVVGPSECNLVHNN